MKEECVWLHRFESLEEAEKAISQWIETYNTERPPEALEWMMPSEWRDRHNQAA